MTVKDGELVWSCRLDEMMEHGCFLTAAPKQAAAGERPKVAASGKRGQAEA